MMSVYRKPCLCMSFLTIFRQLLGASPPDPHRGGRHPTGAPPQDPAGGLLGTAGWLPSPKPPCKNSCGRQWCPTFFSEQGPVLSKSGPASSYAWSSPLMGGRSDICRRTAPRNVWSWCEMTLHAAPWLSGSTYSLSPDSSWKTPAVNVLSKAAKRKPSFRSHNSRPLVRTHR